MAVKNTTTPLLATSIPLHVRLAIIMIKREAMTPCDQTIPRIKEILRAIDDAELAAEQAGPTIIDPDKPF